ncbi:MAG: DUF1924 domain-containing protein [Rhodospirillales bacterium]|nr:DUF1924 domain-containing protein [Rhodospirillales bacterium]
MLTLALATAAILLSAVGAQANPARDAIVAGFVAQAKAENPGFDGFSATRGEIFFKANQVGGKPETPSCTSCHGATPFTPGQTRAGKVIDPMAVSKTQDRYTDPKKVDKWFRRNCNSVLGRECTAEEKGDYLTFMISR